MGAYLKIADAEKEGKPQVSFPVVETLVGERMCPGLPVCIFGFQLIFHAQCTLELAWVLLSGGCDQGCV